MGTRSDWICLQFIACDVSQWVFDFPNSYFIYVCQAFHFESIGLRRLYSEMISIITQNHSLNSAFPVELNDPSSLALDPLYFKYSTIFPPSKFRLSFKLKPKSPYRLVSGINTFYHLFTK